MGPCRLALLAVALLACEEPTSLRVIARGPATVARLEASLAVGNATQTLRFGEGSATVALPASLLVRVRPVPIAISLSAQALDGQLLQAHEATTPAQGQETQVELTLGALGPNGGVVNADGGVADLGPPAPCPGTWVEIVECQGTVAVKDYCGAGKTPLALLRCDGLVVSNVAASSQYLLSRCASCAVSPTHVTYQKVCCP